MIEGFRKFNKDNNYTALIPAYDGSAKELVDEFIQDEAGINCHQTKPWKTPFYLVKIHVRLLDTLE